MKRPAFPSVLATALLAVGFGACSTSDSNNSGSATADSAPAAAAGTVATETAAPQAGQTPAVAAEGAAAIGTVTTVAGSPLPQGYAVDYSAGAHSAPVFSWKNGAGQTASLEDYRGKVVMVNFWGTWCPPCRRELPDIVRLRDNLAPKGFEVIGVSVGERPPAGVTVEQHLADFADNNDLRYPLLIGDGSIAGYYGGISAVPTTFIINKEGKVVNMLVGGMTEERFRQAVEAVL